MAAMLPRKWMVAAVAVALGTSAGCSFIFVGAPPPDHTSRRYFDCTSSALAPAIDATLGGLIAIGMLDQSNQSSGDQQERVEGVVAVGVAIASATYGFLRTSRCRAAKEALAERLLAPSPQPAYGLGAAPTPAQRAGDPWLSEGLPPGGNDWRPVPPPPADAGGRDAKGTDR